MPSPSLIAQEDEFAAAEVVDAELVPEGPGDIIVVCAAVRSAARIGAFSETTRAYRMRLEAALARLEAHQS